MTPLSIFFSFFVRKYPQIYVEKLEMPNLTFFAAGGHTKPFYFTVGYQWKKSENLRWERIALTRAIFKLWRWGWYQNAQKSIPQSGVSGRGSGVRGQGSKQGSNIKIWVFLELFSRLHQLVTPILTPDPQPTTPDPWPLTGECSSEHFGTNPIFIALKLPLWEQFSSISSGIPKSIAFPSKWPFEQRN